MGIEFILKERFDHGMNILNFAIDQESTEVIRYFSETLTKNQIDTLVSHRYAKEMQAIH